MYATLPARRTLLRRLHSRLAAPHRAGTLPAALLLSLGLMTPLSASAEESAADDVAPRGKTECIAPAKPGGGWDFTCRSVARLLDEQNLIPAGMQTLNVPGASGGVAFAHVKSKRHDDEQVIVAASSATTTRLGQHAYQDGKVDDVRWLVTLGADYGVIAVAADSPYQSLTQLLEAMKQDPKSVRFAGGDVAGGFDHLKVLMAARAAGIESLRALPYLAYDSGSVAITQVMGGHLEAFTGDMSEARGFVESGNLRLLAVFSEERLPGQYSNIPTAREQGIDVIAPNWRGFYLPGGASDAAFDWWETALNKVADSPEWQKTMQDNGLMPFHKSGKALETFITRQVSDVEQLSRELGLL
ncbi:Bug family tripartite tricarboxylate transporter substrate binding protein [Cobetia crustatorum]|nr:tripartite tricarboxylate transporter substrate-binding protein [Cobetia crustatorum]